jgi:uncharacterized protein (DUF2126 family)
MRFIDSALEQPQIRIVGATGARYAVARNGWRVLCIPTGAEGSSRARTQRRFSHDP